MSTNWEKLGDEVRKTVQDAVENRNFEKLNQTISETLKTKYSGYKTYTTDFEKAKKASGESFGGSPFRKQVPQKVETKLPSKVGAIAVTVFGYALGVVEFVWFVVTFAASLLVTTSLGIGPQILTAVLSVFAAILSGIGFFVGSTGTKKLLRMNRFKTYLSAVREKEYCNISELASKVGKNSKTVIKDLEYMIRKRWFLQGHLDKQKTCLIATDQMYQQYQLLEQQKLIAQKEEMEKAQLPKTVSENELPLEIQKVIEQGDAYVQKIRKCNDGCN